MSIVVRNAVLACWLVLGGTAGVAPPRAQEAPPATAAPTTTTTVPEGTDESVGFESPRSAMRGFLWAGRADDWAAAAKYLDLRGRDAKDGPRLARELKTVLDRKLWVDLDALSTEPEGDPNDRQVPNRDAAGAFQLANGDWAKILLERVPGPGNTRQWKIARSTVQQMIHSAADRGLDRERQRSVEAQVAAWRAERSLPLPHMSPERAAEISDTLEWPVPRKT